MTPPAQNTQPSRQAVQAWCHDGKPVTYCGCSFFRPGLSFPTCNPRELVWTISKGPRVYAAHPLLSLSEVCALRFSGGKVTVGVIISGNSRDFITFFLLGKRKKCTKYKDLWPRWKKYFKSLYNLITDLSASHRKHAFYKIPSKSVHPVVNVGCGCLL